MADAQGGVRQNGAFGEWGGEKNRPGKYGANGLWGQKNRGHIHRVYEANERIFDG
jgi:hypothetical protein